MRLSRLLRIAVTKEIVRWRSIAQSTVLTTELDLVLHNKTRRKAQCRLINLSYRRGYQLCMPCPPNLYGSNSKSCAVRHFDVLVSVFLPCWLSEDVATQLTISILPHILNQRDPPVLEGSDETRQVTNKSSESRGKKGRDGGWNWVEKWLTGLGF